MLALSEPYLLRWVRFVQERFEPISHFALISLFFAAHVSFSGASGAVFSKGALAAVFAGTVAFFFKLRLYDEIKDYEVDLEFNPTRPLARGLLLHRDLIRGIAVCILVELVAFGLQGPRALLMAAVAIGYSLLMYKEFFIGARIRPLLTTYAVSHTFVSVLLSCTVLSSLLPESGTFGTKQVLFALSSWCLFNVFEFGRKTFLASEERERVASYSKIFGRMGAVLLVLVMAAGSAFLLFEAGVIESGWPLWCLIASLDVLVAFGVLYGALNRKPFGALYRALSSVYILLVYVIIVLTHWSGA